MVLKTVYVGPIIQSKSLTELDINLHGSIGVDENGKILFVEREQVARSDKAWLDAEFVHLGENEFFFPGFIGMISTPSSTWIRLYDNDSLTERQTHTFMHLSIPTPECLASRLSWTG
jgi:hypothetical protein